MTKTTKLSPKKSGKLAAGKTNTTKVENSTKSKFQKRLKRPGKLAAQETDKKTAKIKAVGSSSPAGPGKKTLKKMIGEAKGKIPKQQHAATPGVKRTRDDGETAQVLPSKKAKLEEMKKKERKIVRKSQRNNYELSKKAKRLWESLRREDCPKQTQMDLSQELYNLIKDNIKELVYAHDTTRVIECLILLGSEQIQKDLYEALKDDICSLMKSKYAKHIVMKMLKHGSKEQRNAIIKAMYGKVAKLIRHSEAANVVEFAYNEFANAQQRACMTEEFYGPTFALFKDNEIKNLTKVLHQEPFQKDGILAHMKETLNAVVDKSVIKHSLIHHVLLEYLTHCNPRDRSEMIESIREHVVEILHTKNGARVGMQCIYHGTAKDRKIIIKSMKSHVFKVCIEQDGLMVLLAIFDFVDDTKLVQQVIIEELMRKAVDLAFHPHGRKVLLYLVAPRNTLYFHPQFTSILEQGDHNLTSKKGCDVRRQEHLKFVSANLLTLVADNAEKMIFCSSASVVAQAILIHCIGNPLPAFEKIVECAEKPYDVDDKSSTHIIEHTAGHMFLKRLLQNDKLKAQAADAVLFSRILLDLIPSSILPSWIECNRGCFTVLLLLETEIPSVVTKVRKLLKSSMERIHTLKLKLKGAELLYAALLKDE